MPKTRGKSQRIGEAGQSLVALLVSEMGHNWHDRRVDHGIDGSIELVDPATEAVTNKHVFVQSKGKDAKFPGETDTGFYYLFEPGDIDYWMNSDIPVIVVCSHPGSRDAWWAHVQAAFADPATRKERRIDFDKTADRFEGEHTSESLFSLADPYARAHTPGPREQPETLLSNLLPVDFPEVCFSRTTEFFEPKKVLQAQQRSGLPVRYDYMISAGTIYSFTPFEGTGLDRIGKYRPATRPVGELIGGTPAERRIFVGLLNGALRQDSINDCEWHHERNIIYVRAPSDLKTKKMLTSHSGRLRQMFKAYPNKNDPTRIGYCKHSALISQFIELDGEWYCEVLPDYHFTSNGRQESSLAPILRRGIKEMEHHPAVRQETRMWIDYLRRNDQTLMGDDSLLTFGDPIEFKVELGIHDALWEAKPPNPADPDAQQMSLEEFEAEHFPTYDADDDAADNDPGATP